MANIGEVGDSIQAAFHPNPGDDPAYTLTRATEQLIQMQAAFSEATADSEDPKTAAVQHMLVETLRAVSDASAIFLGAVAAKDELLTGWGIQPATPLAVPPHSTRAATNRPTESDRLNVEIATASAALYKTYSETVVKPRQQRWQELKNTLGNTTPTDIEVKKYLNGPNNHFYVTARWKFSELVPGEHNPPGSEHSVVGGIRVPNTENELFTALTLLQQPKTFSRLRPQPPILGIPAVWDKEASCYRYPADALASRVTEEIAQRIKSVSLIPPGHNAQPETVNDEEYIGRAEAEARRLHDLGYSNNEALLQEAAESSRRSGATDTPGILRKLENNHKAVHSATGAGDGTLDKIQSLMPQQRKPTVTIKR